LPILQYIYALRLSVRMIQKIDVKTMKLKVASAY